MSDDLAPQVHDWDNPTDAEFAADIWHREHSRGRHGVREWPRTEVFRALATERAQAVLDALARRRARRVETAEELDALPDRAVVIDADEDVWQKMGRWWAYPGAPGDFGHAAVTLPAQVLWLPEVSS